MKRFLQLLLCFAITFGFTGCSKTETKSIDEQFISGVKEGLESRWGKQMEEGSFGSIVTNMSGFEESKRYLKIELDPIKDIVKKDFENKDLQKVAEEYAKSLNDAIESINKISSIYDSEVSNYASILIIREKCIADLINNYNLSIDEKFSDATNSITSNAKKELEKDNMKHWGQGTYLVGTDIPSGEYVIIADNSGQSEYSLRSTDYIGADTEIYDSNTALGSTIRNIYTTISDGKYLYLSNCVAYSIDNYPQLYTDGYGEFRVGIDIEAGFYEVSPRGGYGAISIYTSSLNQGSKSILLSENLSASSKRVKVENGQYLSVINSTIKKVE